MPVIARISFAGSPRVPLFLAGNFMPQTVLAQTHFRALPVLRNLLLIGWVMTTSHIHRTFSCAARSPISYRRVSGRSPRIHHVSYPPYMVDLVLNLTPSWDSSCHYESTPTPLLRPRRLRTLYSALLFILSPRFSCHRRVSLV